METPAHYDGTFDRLIARSAIHPALLAVRANVSTRTVERARAGHRVQRVVAAAFARILLGSARRIDEIDAAIQRQVPKEPKP